MKKVHAWFQRHRVVAVVLSTVAAILFTVSAPVIIPLESFVVGFRAAAEEALDAARANFLALINIWQDTIKQWRKI